MDAISAMLAGQRAEGVFVIRSDVVAPWSIRIADRAPLTIVVLVRGSAALVLDEGEPLRLEAGDSALLSGDVGYLLADDPATSPQALIGPGQTCSKPDGSPLSDFRDLGVRTWGNVPDGGDPETVLLTGTYQHVGQVSRELIDHVPGCVVVSAAQAPSAVSSTVGLLGHEIASRAAGQGVVLDRLIDLVAVSLLRAWLDRADLQPAWYAAYRDPILGGVLRRMHHEPARRWTLDLLAREVGVSRATLARRFTEKIGESPMSYLAHRRIDLAADLLATTSLTVEAVAGRVGYGSAYSLSNAFSRRHGQSPSAYRRGRHAAA